MAVPRLTPEVKVPKSYASLPYETIRVSHHPESSAEATPLVIITLYRPKNNNAFNDKMMLELEDFYGKANVDDRVKAIVMTGHGKMFCAGLDLLQGFRLEIKGETEKTHRDEGGRVSLAMHNCSKPTIGAINGHAVGVGITMTLAMTTRVCWSRAKIGFIFARRGLVCEGASSFFLPRLVGYGRAVHLCTTGTTYQADHKMLDGLFAELMDKQEDVLPRAIEIAEDIAKNCSTVSTMLMREMIFRGKDTPEDAHLLESRVMGALRGGEDNEEGVKSFMEKRPVNFKGTMAKNAPSIYPWHNPTFVGVRPEDPKPKI